MIHEAIRLYREAGSCVKCFETTPVNLPSGGCRFPQPRWIGPKYRVAEPRILVCLINPGAGREPEREFENLLFEFFQGKQNFYEINDYIGRNIKSWGGGKFLRMINHHMKLDLRNVAIMNISLCPMVDNEGVNYHSRYTLDTCFQNHTSKIMSALQPDKVVLCGASIHCYKQWIETNVGSEVALAPHYAARLRLTELQETYSKIRQFLHGVD